MRWYGALPRLPLKVVWSRNCGDPGMTNDWLVVAASVDAIAEPVPSAKLGVFVMFDA